MKAKGKKTAATGNGGNTNERPKQQWVAVSQVVTQIFSSTHLKELHQEGGTLMPQGKGTAKAKHAALSMPLRGHARDYYHERTQERRKGRKAGRGTHSDCNFPGFLL